MSGEANFVGDLLLCFGNDAMPGPGRLGLREWTCLAEWPGQRLWTQPSRPGWKGFPLRKERAAGWTLYVVGELYGDSRAPDLLARDAPPFNGHAIVLGREDASGCWRVASDRYGTLHAHYARSGERAALGTFSPAVAESAQAQELDLLALGAWCAFGFFPGDRTQRAGMRVLRPATLLALDAAGAVQDESRPGRWPAAPDARLSYADAVARCAERVETVVAEHVARGRVALPLSGGLDSRTVAAALGRRGPLPGPERLWAFAYGYADDSRELELARAVARARRLPFGAHVVGAYLFDELPGVLAATEGGSDLSLCRQHAVRATLTRHADFVLGGHWGDVWLDALDWLPGRAHAGPAEFLDAILARFLSPCGRRLLELWRGPALTEATLRELLAGELERLRAIEDPELRLKALKTEQWSFRWTMAGVRAYQAAAFPRLPFYDARLTELLARLPPGFLRGRRLQVDVIRRLSSPVARVPWERTDAPLGASPLARLGTLPPRAWAKARRALSGRHPVERNGELQLAGPRGRAGLERWLLRPDLRLHGLFDPAALRALVEEGWTAPRSPAGDALTRLVTLSAWLEHHG